MNRLIDSPQSICIYPTLVWAVDRSRFLLVQFEPLTIRAVTPPIAAQPQQQRQRSSRRRRQAPQQTATRPKVAIDRIVKSVAPSRGFPSQSGLSRRGLLRPKTCALAGYLGAASFLARSRDDVGYYLAARPARPLSERPKARPIVGAWRRTTGASTGHEASIGRWLAVYAAGMDRLWRRMGWTLAPFGRPPIKQSPCVVV
jgi:hypothetical protein